MRRSQELEEPPYNTVTVTVENLDSSDVIVTLLTLLFIILRSYSITDTRKNTCCLRGKSSDALLD